MQPTRTGTPEDWQRIRDGVLKADVSTVKGCESLVNGAMPGVEKLSNGDAIALFGAIHYEIGANTTQNAMYHVMKERGMIPKEPAVTGPGNLCAARFAGKVGVNIARRMK